MYILGGSGDDAGYALKMDPSGNLVALSSTGGIAGTLTVPSNGMASLSSMVTIPPGNRDVVIGKFTTDGPVSGLLILEEQGTIFPPRLISMKQVISYLLETV